MDNSPLKEAVKRQAGTVKPAKGEQHAAATPVQAGRFDIIDHVLPQRDLLKLEDALGNDEQSWDLAVQVYQKIAEKLRLSDREGQALYRLMDSVKNMKSWKGDLQRNNIFKAANLLGIKLPSSMF
jgi:hypothetical protein